MKRGFRLKPAELRMVLVGACDERFIRQAKAIIGPGAHPRWLIEASARVCSGTAFLMLSHQVLSFSDTCFFLMRLALTSRHGDLRKSSANWAAVSVDAIVEGLMPVFQHGVEQLSAKHPDGSRFVELTGGQSAIELELLRQCRIVSWPFGASPALLASKSPEYDSRVDQLVPRQNVYLARIHALADVIASTNADGNQFIIPVNDEMAEALAMPKTSLGRSIEELVHRGILEIADARHSFSGGRARRFRLRVTVEEFLLANDTGRLET